MKTRWIQERETQKTSKGCRKEESWGSNRTTEAGAEDWFLSLIWEKSRREAHKRGEERGEKNLQVCYFIQHQRRSGRREQELMRTNQKGWDLLNWQTERQPVQTNCTNWHSGAHFWCHTRKGAKNCYMKNEERAWERSSNPVHFLAPGPYECLCLLRK